MFIEGLIQNTKPQGAPFGPNQTRYSFAELVDADGHIQTLMFVNRDVQSLEGCSVLITDMSENEEKVKYEMDAKGQPRFRIYGTKVSIQLEDGSELGLGQQQQNYAGHDPNQVVRAAAPQPQRQQPQQPQQQQRPQALAPQPQRQTPQAQNNNRKAASMAALIDFGLQAVNYARAQGEDSEAVLASVFGAAMYGYKEGRPSCPDMDHTGRPARPAQRQAPAQQRQTPAPAPAPAPAPESRDSWPDENDAIPTEWDINTGDPY